MGRLYFLLIIKKFRVFQTFIYRLKFRKTIQTGSCTKIMLGLILHHGIYHIVFGNLTSLTVIFSLIRRQFIKIFTLKLLN